MSVRERNYDLLRGISSLFVVILHWGCFFCGKNYESDKYAYLIGCFAQSVSRFAVPCFLMLSGAFVLADPKIENVVGFWKKTVKKIIVPVLLFSILYVLFSYARLFAGDSGQNTHVFQPLIDWFKGVPYYHMWYAYMLIGMYFAAPFIQAIKKRVSKKHYLSIIVVAFFIGIITEYFLDLVWCLQFVTYSGYFMLGDYIRNCSEKKKQICKYKNFMLIVAILLLIIIFGLSYGLKDTYTFYQPMFPLVVLASLMIFLWFSYTDVKTNLDWIAKKTLFIYILHVGIMDCLNIIVIKFWGYPSAIWYFPVGVACTMLLSVLGANVIIRIQLGFNSIVRKNSRLQEGDA